MCFVVTHKRKEVLVTVNASDGDQNDQHKFFFWRTLRDYGLGPMPHGSGDVDNVYSCPVAARVARPIHEKAGDPVVGVGVGMFGYNAFGLDGKRSGLLGLGGAIDQGGRFRPVRESEVVNPSQMLAMGDAIEGWSGQFGEGPWIARVSSFVERTGSERRVRNRHNGRIHTLFSDGHCEATGLEILFADASASALRLWNIDFRAHGSRLVATP